MTTTRMFKRINLFGLDFYVDWVKETGELISIKEVHSGKRFVYEGLKNESGEKLEDVFRKSVGAELPPKEEIKAEEPKKEEPAEIKQMKEEPAALETEQPKEKVNETPKTGRRKGKK